MLETEDGGGMLEALSGYKRERFYVPRVVCFAFVVERFGVWHKERSKVIAKPYWPNIDTSLIPTCVVSFVFLDPDLVAILLNLRVTSGLIVVSCFPCTGPSIADANEKSFTEP